MPDRLRRRRICPVSRVQAIQGPERQAAVPRSGDPRCLGRNRAMVLEPDLVPIVVCAVGVLEPGAGLDCIVPAPFNKIKNGL